MNKAFFTTYMNYEPSNPAERFMFLVDSKALSERIVLSGYRSTPILSYDTDDCFTLDTFREYLRSLQCKGTCRSSYVYVIACSSKALNDTLSACLNEELLTFRSGWRLFRGKEYLEDPENEEELKTILNTYIQESSPKHTAIKTKSVSEIDEEEVEWLVSGYVPGGQITLLVGDGGQGKTSVWCNLVAGITSAKKTLLEERIPFPVEKEPGNCMFFSSEDSVPKVLKKRLKMAEADESRIRFVDLTDPDFDRIKFDSAELEGLIAEHKPSLVVFDPLQSFIPPTVQMGSRNAMRQCLSPLIALGERFGTAFLIVMHTNKKTGVSGRTRCADSADIWDIARSVLIVGYTGEGDIHYLSQEKCNYAELSDTVLYTIENGTVVFKGVTQKRDKDYVLENAQTTRTAPARNEAKEIIMNALRDGKDHKVSDIDDMVKSSGVSFATLKRSKSELKSEGKILYSSKGFGGEKTFYMRSAREEDTK